MYSIGQFSMMLNLNKKTLRYYDEIELFKPSYVDSNNQYRYYDETQISVIKEIMQLKDIGIPLEQIKKVVNEQNPEQLKETYFSRLKEIETLLKQLKMQENLIKARLKEDKTAVISECEYSIERGYFIEDGYVYYNNVNCDYENINTAISEFYAGAGKIALKTGHIFRRSFDDTSKGICEIFAYTESNEKNEKVRVQKKLMCLKVTCGGFSQKEYAYKVLFGYIQKEGCHTGDVYERYTMIDGKMIIEIVCNII